MKLYHVSRNINMREYFEPRIPQYSNDNESKCKRICLSSSLEGAISATFYHWFKKENIISNTGEIYFKGKKKLKFSHFSEAIIYEFDTKNIQKNNIIRPWELFSKYNVYDAEHTKEYWVINQRLTPKSMKLKKLKYCDYYTNFRVVYDRNYQFHCISDIKSSKIYSLEEYLDEINMYYNEERLYAEKEKVYKELLTQIYAREVDNPVTRLFLKKIKTMEEKSIVKRKESNKLEYIYFDSNH